MAKTALVKLTKDSDWQEVEVANFYDPEVHHTVRVDGSAKKTKYFKMKMQDGRVYDKEKEKWEFISAETPDLMLFNSIDLPLNCQPQTIQKITLTTVLEKCDDVIGVMKECSRVLIPGGRLETSLPLAPGRLAFSNPEFKNYFTELTFNYFVPELFSRYTYRIQGEVLNITLKK